MTTEIDELTMLDLASFTNNFSFSCRFHDFKEKEVFHFIYVTSEEQTLLLTSIETALILTTIAVYENRHSGTRVVDSHYVFRNNRNAVSNIERKT